MGQSKKMNCELLIKDESDDIDIWCKAVTKRVKQILLIF